MPKVVITLKADGAVTTEAFGFKGKQCLEKTKFLDKLFGKPAHQDLKASYHEESEVESDFIINQNGTGGGHCG